MRRCAEAVARTVLAFLDAVIVGCLRSCFGARPRRGSGRRDALVHGDRAAAAEVVWDDVEGLARDGRVHEELGDGAGIDEELRREATYLELCGTISETPAELRKEESYEINLENANEERDNKPTSGPPADCKSLFEANSSEGCEERHSLRSELNTEDAGYSASSEKRLFQNILCKPLDSDSSPFPTPLVLRDDMQTPGTAYASHRGTSISGKRVQTRKQFIYPVLRTIENRLKQTELTEDSSPLAWSNPLKGTNLEADPMKEPTQRSSTPSSSARLPKAWDGNGIPNTTTKYREDQRVNWRATPFEQRLLQLLSDEDCCPSRKVVQGKLFHLKEAA